MVPPDWGLEHLLPGRSTALRSLTVTPGWTLPLDSVAQRGQNPQASRPGHSLLWPSEGFNTVHSAM